MHQSIRVFSMACLLSMSGLALAEADYLDGKWTVFVNLTQPTGDARLGSLTESVLVIGAKVSPPKLTREDWLDSLPSLRGKWKAYPTGGDKSPIAPMGAGFQITAIKDVTPIPHNGCRPRKRRRV